MKAVVMAGGEARTPPPARLFNKADGADRRPPVHGAHRRLLKLHGIEDVLVTLAFMPRRSGHTSATATPSASGCSTRSRSLLPVRRARWVCRGSARRHVPRHLGRRALRRRPLRAGRIPQGRGASVTIGLKSVENPLGVGIVVCDDEGRIERPGEDPRGARCSRHDQHWASTSSSRRSCVTYRTTAVTTSRRALPAAARDGRPLYGYVMDGYWQDIGNLDQYRQANFDALDEKVRLDVPGIKLRGDVWLGECRAGRRRAQCRATFVGLLPGSTRQRRSDRTRCWRPA